MDSLPTNVQPEFPRSLGNLADGEAISPPLPFGPFTLRRLVRRSQMSLVCEGTHAASNRRVAVKLCLPQADRRRFQREIELTRRIRTTGVIKILDHDGVGETLDRCPYYATLWIEGPTLGEFLQDDAPTLEEKLEVFEQLCTIMGQLHHERWDGQPVTHRDLKPSNIKVVMDADGRRPVLLDWGLACAEGANDLTLTGAHPGGTPGYYPSWSLNHPRWVKTYGKCWDVYSLAVILVEVLTKARPAGNDDPRFTPTGVRALLRAHLPDNRRLEDLLARCFASHPRESPPTAEDFLIELRACRDWRRSRARKWRYAGAAMLAGLILAVGHEVFRAAAPDAYQALISRLRGKEEETPPLPANLARDPQIISWTNFTLRLNVSPVGTQVRVVNHRANGLVVTNLTAPPTGQMEILLPDDPDARYSVEAFLSGYHPVTQAVDPDSGPLTIRLEKLRGEVEFLTTAGAFIHLRHEGGEARTAGPVPAAGKLRVQSLDEGTWDWQIHLADHETNSGRIARLLSGRPEKVERPLKPLPGRLSVVGQDTLTVWAGANRLGVANEWIPLPAGTHDLTLRRPGFRSQSLRVDIPPNRDISLVASNWVVEAGSLRITMDVPAAAAECAAKASKRLLLDGVPLTVNGFPDLKGNVGVGTHTVRLEVAGFAPMEQTGVQVRDAETTELRFPLQPLPARLTIAAEPAHAEVYRVSGGKLGPAGTAIEIPALEPLIVEVQAPGYRSEQRRIPPLAPDSAKLEVVKLQSLPRLVPPSPSRLWTNILSMIFVPVPGTPVLFSIWETRVKDYEQFVEETGRDWPRPRFDQGPTHPAVNVSWVDGKAFCKWLTEREHKLGRLPAGWEYRLPTDAEWSLAVGLINERGTTPKDKNDKTNNVYPWGSHWPPLAQAGNYSSLLKVDSFEFTSPVGSFAPNRFGLCDLGGNVWEWCEDEYHWNSGTRVLRGGAWDCGHAVNLASGSRHREFPGYRDEVAGFRVVLAGFSSR